MHDVIGCYLDLGSGEIKFTKNGVDLGKAFTIPQQLKSSALFPAVVLKVSEAVLFL
jgi:ATP-dependent RNA helicase DDX1